MKCKKFLKKVDLLAEKEISGPESARFMEHAHACPDCGKALNTAQNEIEAMNRMGESCRRESEERIERTVAAVMDVVNALPGPAASVHQEESSLVYKAIYTLYNALVLGLMVSVTYLVLFRNFFSVEEMLFSTEAQFSLFGVLCIIIGCIFILVKGKEVNIWLVSRIRHSALSFQITADSVLLLMAGVSFCLFGGFLIFSGIF